MEFRKNALGPLEKAFKASIVLLGHFVCIVVWLSLFALLEKLLTYLSDGHAILLFDRMPLSYVFHAIDLGILFVFAFWGIVEANAVWKKA